MQEVLPNETEILQWILGTAVHAFNIEWFLEKLQVGSEDPDRPHDIVNPFNKLEWPAIKGFALQYRKDGDTLFHEEIMASREYHRQQYHHQMWRQPSPNVSEDARKLSAVDAICSMLEPRGYQDGIHTWTQIKKKINPKNSAPHQIPWMEYAYGEMEKLDAERPNLVEITSLLKIPKTRISPINYDIIIGRARETIIQLEKDHGYRFSTKTI